MDILYFIHRFPLFPRRLYLDEIAELRSRGHDVGVFALNRPRTDRRHDRFRKLDIPIGYADGLPEETETVMSSAPLSPSVRDSIASQCCSYVSEREFAPDVVHSHLATPDKLGAAEAASRLGIPCTVTAHAIDLYDERADEWSARVLESMDRIVTISEYNARFISSQRSVSTPVDVVYAGIRTDEFHPSGNVDPRRVLTVGRFVEKKGIPYGVRAFADVKSTVPNAEYRIVGTGPERSSIERAVNRTKAGDSITLLRNLDDTKLRKEMDRAAVFVLPCVVAENGDRDGVPVAAMEAMAMETAVVSSTISGIPELILDGYNGRTVPPRDVESLAEAMTSLLVDESERRRMASRARETVLSQFDVSINTEELLKVFHRTVDGQQSRSE